MLTLLSPRNQSKGVMTDSFMSMGGALPPTTHQEILDSAARLVDKHLQEDKNYMDLSDELRVPAISK